MMGIGQPRTSERHCARSEALGVKLSKGYGHLFSLFMTCYYPGHSDNLTIMLLHSWVRIGTMFHFGLVKTVLSDRTTRTIDTKSLPSI